MRKIRLPVWKFELKPGESKISESIEFEYKEITDMPEPDIADVKESANAKAYKKKQKKLLQEQESLGNFGQ